MDLKVGLREAFKLIVGNWSHVQKLDYEQLPFKYLGCHEYGHFARNFPTKVSPPVDKEKAERWQQVKKPKTIIRYGPFTPISKNANTLGEI